MTQKWEGSIKKQYHISKRHAFGIFHYALHANENLTSQQAGNSPAMIHQHFKGLATKAEVEKWFTVMPPK